MTLFALSSGAEARIFQGDYEGVAAIKKERFEKKYRHPHLDKRLAKQRTRAEIRSLERLAMRDPEKLGKLLPQVLNSDERTIIMTRIVNSKTANQVLSECRRAKDDDAINQMLQKIGTLVGLIHQSKIIHGDLTTSNILINEHGDLIPIDFGLSFTSESSEDRAVDLYVLQRALQSTEIEDCKFQQFLQTYREQLDASVADGVVKKFEEVRSRGRKRLMIG